MASGLHAKTGFSLAATVKIEKDWFQRKGREGAKNAEKNYCFAPVLLVSTSSQAYSIIYSANIRNLCGLSAFAAFALNNMYMAGIHLLYPFSLGSGLNNLFDCFDLEENGVQHRDYDQREYRSKAQAEHDDHGHVEEEHICQ